MQPQFGKYYDETTNAPLPQYPPVTSDFRNNRNCDELRRPNPNFSKARKQCNVDVLPLPNPVQLGGSTDYQWDYEDRVRRDCCAVTLDEKESQRPGYYQLSGFDPQTQHANNYADRMNEITHFQKVYRNAYSYADDETDLTRSEVTNLREINQLFTRPYVGSFSGPGAPSLNNKDLETALFQGLLTNLRQKPCEVTRGTSLFRFQCLPDFGNPQKIAHIEPPPVEFGGWARSGLPSRDLVRRVDYQRRCLNRENANVVNKLPRCGNGHGNGPFPNQARATMSMNPPHW